MHGLQFLICFRKSEKQSLHCMVRNASFKNFFLKSICKNKGNTRKKLGQGRGEGQSKLDLKLLVVF